MLNAQKTIQNTKRQEKKTKSTHKKKTISHICANTEKQHQQNKKVIMIEMFSYLGKSKDTLRTKIFSGYSKFNV